MEDYKNIISHIDLDRNLDAIEFFGFNGIDDSNFSEFKEDIEAGNDSIELHLIKSRSYKEALVLSLKRTSEDHSKVWKEFLKEEQKTFGGSKIFYISNDCSKLLVLSLPNEMNTKVNMLVTRLNKVNEKISRLNLKIKKENMDIYSSRAKHKELHKKADDIINFINQNLRV